MGDGLESSVQIAPDSTGKKVRTLEVEAVLQDTDGTWKTATVEMQVVSIADKSGRIVNLDMVEYLELIDEKLERIAAAVESMAAFTGPERLADTDEKGLKPVISDLKPNR